MVMRVEGESGENVAGPEEKPVRQEYQAPTLKRFGRLSRLTQGSGITGSADQFAGNKGKGQIK